MNSRTMTLDDLDTPAVASQPVFKPSLYQQAVFDYIESDKGNLRVEAVAGSGKTTTMSKASSFLSPRLKIKMMVFSKQNANDMQTKVPSFVTATTAHAAGYADIRRLFKSVKVDERKMWNLLNERYRYNDGIQANGADIVKLVSLCKNTLREPNETNLDYLCDRFGINPNGNSDVVYPATKTLYDDSRVLADRIIDFDDMVFIPALEGFPVEQADVLFVDEAQDTNAAQQAYYLKVSKGRTIFVGDTHQAIYGFRGADTEAMDNLSAALQPSALPLSICYRCPQHVIALAQQIVPQIQARENAPEGVVATIDISQLMEKVERGNMVLCRLNAPLVKPAFELIRNGIKAVIRGRDIGKNLVTFIQKAQRMFNTLDLNDTLGAMDSYVQREEYKLLSLHKDNQAQMIRDQFDTIIALSEGCHTISDVEWRIQKVFSDEVEGIVFSSVHKAKGLEAKRVFILKPNLLNPQKWDKQAWQLQQLSNLKYVAITRALAELYFVEGGDETTRTFK